MRGTVVMGPPVPPLLESELDRPGPEVESAVTVAVSLAAPEAKTEVAESVTPPEAAVNFQHKKSLTKT